MEKTNYRPANIEFDVATDDSPVPGSLGFYETADAAILFMQKNFFSTNSGVTVNRFMDNFEKNEIRKTYNEILENRIPLIEQDLRQATEEYNQAKSEMNNVQGMLTAYFNEAKGLAIHAKRGLVDMKLDELFTWKLPYKGRFYYFTFIDFNIRLVKITDMTSYEKTELFSQGKINEDYFDQPCSPQ